MFIQGIDIDQIVEEYLRTMSSEPYFNFKVECSLSSNLSLSGMVLEAASLLLSINKFRRNYKHHWFTEYFKIVKGKKWFCKLTPVANLKPKMSQIQTLLSSHSKKNL